MSTRAVVQVRFDSERRLKVCVDLLMINQTAIGSDLGNLFLKADVRWSLLGIWTTHSSCNLLSTYCELVQFLEVTLFRRWTWNWN